MDDSRPDPDTTVAALPNGVRVLVLRLPHVGSASVSVFVRTGSLHESPKLNGISHVVEHMAFKGTATRSCQQINLDAERLGAEVNAHTDKDHTAFHMRGMARDAAQFVRMLADIVRHSTFPETELERERQVILQELTEEEDDPLSEAFRLFDRLCFGMHPAGQPVIGTRRNIERFTRADLLDYVQRQYGGANVVVGVAGDVRPDEIVRVAEAAFGDMPRGEPNALHAPAYEGGARTRRMAGSSQTHVVLGWPVPGLADAPEAAIVAATLFGEGMSSPLLDRVRERLGLAYYTACSADLLPVCGQFVIEASTSPGHVGPLLAEVKHLLVDHAGHADSAGLQRARNQIAVRRLRTQERPHRRLEEAAQDLFVHGRVRSPAELAARIDAVSAEDVRAAFERMLGARAAVAMAGAVPRAASHALTTLLDR